MKTLPMMPFSSANPPLGRIAESCKKAIRGGFAAMTPQQSGAATTSAIVIGTPCIVAASLLLRQAYGGHVCWRVPTLRTLCAHSSDFVTFGRAPELSHRNHNRPTKNARLCTLTSGFSNPPVSLRARKLSKLEYSKIDCAEKPYSFRRPFGLAGFLRMR